MQLLQGAGHGGLVGAFTAQDVLTGEVAANLSIDEIRVVLSASEQAATVGRVRELYELFQLHNVGAEAQLQQQRASAAEATGTSELSRSMLRLPGPQCKEIANARLGAENVFASLMLTITCVRKCACGLLTVEKISAWLRPRAVPRYILRGRWRQEGAAGGRSRRAGGKDNRHAEKKIVEAAERISRISSW